MIVHSGSGQRWAGRWCWGARHGIGLNGGGLRSTMVGFVLRRRGRELASCLGVCQLSNDPMKIGDHFFKECNLVGGSYRGGPPRQCHDCEENAVFTVGRKLAPTDTAVEVPREWPLLCIALLWLGHRPPLYPLGSIGVGTDNDGRLVQ